MDYVRIKASLISSINYLRKHLYDSPADNPTNVPKVTPDGTMVKTVNQVAALMNTDIKTASLYICQDPNADIFLKTIAKNNIKPGIFVAPDDAYLPVLNKVEDILTNNIDTKRIRMVRTAAGVRKFSQPQGSIIVTDGQAPLDGLVALPNDVPGFEKIAARNGAIFYVGNAGKNKWVVYDPQNQQALHVAKTQIEGFQWLNNFVGGTRLIKPKAKK